MVLAARSAWKEERDVYLCTENLLLTFLSLFLFTQDGTTLCALFHSYPKFGSPVHQKKHAESHRPSCVPSSKEDDDWRQLNMRGQTENPRN
jgi:hypothetical protein